MHCNLRVELSPLSYFFSVHFHPYFDSALGHNSLGLVMVLFFIIVPTLALEKVFIHLRILAPMLVAFGIRHSGWSAMYQGYLTVSLLS